MALKRSLSLLFVLLAVAGGYGLSKALSAWRNQAVIDRYCASHKTRKLQLGAGSVNLADWLNTDREPRSEQAYLDATKRFPLPDGSIHYIFGEQLIEHLSYEDGLKMLGECYRVLVPGGKIRLATPDLLRFTALFENAPEEYVHAKFAFQGWPMKPAALLPAFVINEELREWGHQFVYDEATLRDSLSKAGFESIQRFDPGLTDEPVFDGLEVLKTCRL